MNKEEVFKAFVSFVEKKWERVLLPLSAEYEWNGCDGDTTIEKRREWSRELNAAVSSSDKEKILDDFIRGWGRIYLRDKGRIREFTDVKKTLSLVDKNKCVSSASKALSLWSPTEYFIYDSRVSIALHEMWGECKEVKDLKCPFVLCPSRSEKAKEFMAFLKEVDKTRKVWAGRGYQKFYSEWYIKLIAELRERCEKECPEKIEMALFVYGKCGESEVKRLCYKKN